MLILHAADIHLDSPLSGLRKRAGARGDELADATRHAFKKLIQYAIDSRVALLLISGDNYDGRHRDYGSLLFFATQMLRLRDAGIQVVMIRGNHDAENQMRLKLPEGVHVLESDRAGTVTFPDLKVAVHGQSYPRREVRTNLAAAYPEGIAGYLNIGMLHTAVEGYGGAHQPYAPCTVADLVGKNYDYWALGHVHVRTEILSTPWIVYPGNLQGRHINEQGPKGATLITVASGKITAVEHVPLDVVRWARVEVDVSGLGTIDDISSLMEASIQQAVEEAEGRTLAARIVLKGQTSLHRAMKAEAARIDAECGNAALSVGDVWVESVVLETEDEIGPAAGDEAAAAVLTEAELMKAGAREKVRGAVNVLPGKFSAALRQASGLDKIDDANLDSIIEDARDLLLAKLSP